MTSRTCQAVAQTALWTAAARARESLRPDRLFDDPLAGLLAGARGAELLAHFHTRFAAPDGNPFLPIRTRWFDEFLAAAPARQVVGLGAGLDTRAYRLDWPPATRLFELDQPSLLDYKQRRLDGVEPGQRCDCRRVPADLSGDWAGALREAGFDPSAVTAWFAEGLLFYLPEQLARRLLSELARICRPGSALAVDLIGTGVFRLPYLREFLDRLARAGSPWRFGTDDPAGFVASCGWRPVVVTQPGRPDANYGRWPAAATPDRPVELPRSYLVTAVLDGTAARTVTTTRDRSAVP